MDALQKIGYRAEFCREIPLPIKTAGVVRFPGQAQFHPLKFLAGIADGLNIYEHTFVREMMPYCGLYSRRTPAFYVATGFNKWGMTSSMLSAMIVSDLLLGRENEFAELFDPSRSILRPQLFVNGFEAIKNLLTPSKRVCPHMGCALKWNTAERSWDCPCHGSRFSEDGKVLNNPANGDL